MGLFSKFCRTTGLVIHNVVQPLREERQKTQNSRNAPKQELRRTVEEEKISPTVTVRRTTIEEIEVKRDER